MKQLWWQTTGARLPIGWELPVGHRLMRLRRGCPSVLWPGSAQHGDPEPCGHPAWKKAPLCAAPMLENPVPPHLVWVPALKMEDGDQVRLCVGPSRGKPECSWVCQPAVGTSPSAQEAGWGGHEAGTRLLPPLQTSPSCWASGPRLHHPSGSFLAPLRWALHQWWVRVGERKEELRRTQQ